MKSKPFCLELKGLRIPFVAAWELEQPDIRHCSVVQCDAVFTGDYDHRAQAIAGQLDKVQLGQMAPQRQRYVMANNLCQVCGETLAHRVMLGHPEHHGPDRLFAFDEPPCCPRCALLAIELCPYAKAGWNSRGGIVIEHSMLHVQLAKIKKGDDMAALTRGQGALSRATFRRYMDKPVAVHLRMVVTLGMRVEGWDGMQVLQCLS